MNNHPPAVLDVIAERKRQVCSEGWTAKHDDEHGDGSLALAAACYARHDAEQAKPTLVADPLDVPLPADVRVGHNVFRKGVSLSTFVEAARRWHREAFPEGYTLTDEQKAANLARLRGETPAGVAPTPAPSGERWVMCNDCGTWKQMQKGNHHPWCGCGSDNFRWEDERDHNPEAPASGVEGPEHG